MIEKLLQIRNEVLGNSPLVHCITNHITINDCANVILEVGGKPIMAEHPAEVEEITAISNSLAINLGNISDTRMKSIMLSGKVARDRQIPMIIDVVGVGCSKLRLDFATNFISQCSPNVIKGNISEIKAIANIPQNAKGIDAGDSDLIINNTITNTVEIAKTLSQKTNSIVVITGATDIISDGNVSYALQNGCEMLSKITGTGCILNAIIGTLISSGMILEGAILGTAILGICGEIALTQKGTATFKNNLHDSIFTVTNEIIKNKIRIEEIK